MQTTVLKRFAQEARIVLKTLVGSKMEVVLAEQSVARREASKAVRELETRVHAVGKERVVEQVAYTWFNRFTALQYMDMNGFNRVRVIAPAEGQTRPQILADANAGNFNAYTQENTQNIVNGILSGRSPSHDPDNEASAPPPVPRTQTPPHGRTAQLQQVCPPALWWDMPRWSC